jgi:hypothetical protein
MNDATERAALRIIMPKLRELWEAHTELALAEGSAGETDARAKRNALSAALRADERRIAAMQALTFEAVVDYRKRKEPIGSVTIGPL